MNDQEPTLETIIGEIIASVPGDFVLDFTQGEWVCIYGASPVGDGVGFLAGRCIGGTMREAVTKALHEVRHDNFLAQL